MPTEHEKVRIFIGNGVPEVDVHTWIDSLRDICNARDMSSLVVTFKELVLDYSPSAGGTLYAGFLISKRQRPSPLPTISSRHRTLLFAMPRPSGIPEGLFLCEFLFTPSLPLLFVCRRLILWQHLEASKREVRPVRAPD